MIKENVDLSLVGSLITSMILYRSIVKLDLKSTYSSCSLSDLSAVLRATPSTRSKEIAFISDNGAPFITGAVFTINKVTSGGTKVIVNIAEGNNLEGTGTSSASSSSFFFVVFCFIYK